jgi:hypothetical protein
MTTIGLWKRKAVHSFVGSGKGRREGGREEVGLSGLSCYPLKTQKPTNKVSEKTEKN